MRWWRRGKKTREGAKESKKKERVPSAHTTQMHHSSLSLTLSNRYYTPLSLSHSRTLFFRVDIDCPIHRPHMHHVHAQRPDKRSLGPIQSGALPWSLGLCFPHSLGASELCGNHKEPILKRKDTHRPTLFCCLFVAVGGGGCWINCILQLTLNTIRSRGGLTCAILLDCTQQRQQNSKTPPPHPLPT